jgi:hypothetical protein
MANGFVNPHITQAQGADNKQLGTFHRPPSSRRILRTRLVPVTKGRKPNVRSPRLLRSLLRATRRTLSVVLCV